METEVGLMTSIGCRPPTIYLLGSLLFGSFFLCVPGFGQIAKPDQEIEVHDLPSLVARSPHSADVLLTSLDTIFHNREICCGKDSALEDSAQQVDPKSLKDAASELEGRHLLSDGRAVKVTAEYLTPDKVNAGHLIAMILDQHAPLMEWNSHLYVVHGIVYHWTVNSNPETTELEQSVIHKFLLWDLRYSDTQREVVFDRLTDDMNAVQGVLFLEAKIE
jgi:hypothetical protein